MMGEHRKAMLSSAIKDGGLSVREYWELIADVKAMQTAYAEAFITHQYDAVLMPGLGVTALPHGMAPELLSALSYAFLGKSSAILRHFNTKSIIVQLDGADVNISNI